MTLKEKFESIEFSFPADESKKIAEDFAIGFVEWKDKISSSDLIYSSKYAKTNQELLEIYKKEKGL